MNGLFGIRPAAPLLLNLSEVEMNFEIGRRAVEHLAKLRDRLIGLRVLSQQQGLGSSDRAIFRVRFQRLARGFERFRDIACYPVSVDNHYAGPAIFLGP